MDCRIAGYYPALLQRKPETLSGGEMQKVALARTLVTKPEVLPLDEPLGALDPQTREQMQDKLRRLRHALGIPTINVTHDFEEAVSLGTWIAIIGNI
ncbi:MAG: ATP-binding cassette domain-containing protein [Chloroflexota bacterium]